MTTVAVLGTGIMGAPMARNMAQSGLTVRAWNRSGGKAEPLAEFGITVHDTAAGAVLGADLVVTMLAQLEAVEATMTDDVLAALPAAAVWLQMSTVGMAGTRALAALAARHDVAFVDAPVSGTRQPAEAGQLAVIAAGDATLRERCAPVFEAVGSSTRWVGEVPGAATALKLVLNSWVLAVTDGVSEALSLASGLGLEPQVFLDAIKGGSLDIAYAHLKGALMLRGDYPPSFPLALAEKDAGLIIDAAAEAGVPLSVAPAVRADLQQAINRGHGDDDMSAMHVAHRRATS
ncbi:MAG: mmsB [Frankiales bacterium]|nr:mmsB [Frankiales bacterium]